MLWEKLYDEVLLPVFLCSEEAPRRGERTSTIFLSSVKVKATCVSVKRMHVTTVIDQLPNPDTRVSNWTQSWNVGLASVRIISTLDVDFNELEMMGLLIRLLDWGVPGCNSLSFRQGFGRDGNGAVLWGRCLQSFFWGVWDRLCRKAFVVDGSEVLEAGLICLLSARWVDSAEFRINEIARCECL